MTPEDVLAIVDALTAAGVRCWLDGGWGVDALMGRQTRPHDDVDVVLPLPETGAAIGALARLGFGVAPDGGDCLYPAADLVTGTIGGRPVGCAWGAPWPPFERGA